MKDILFGAAYYDEYMPVDRIDTDIAMMKAAGINTVRIAESTWSTCEPQPGAFDFSHVERVIDKTEAAGINVIIGTPTYAIPSWMAEQYPDVIATTHSGRNIYGPRQIMDITHPAYLFYAERVIRRLMECTAQRNNVIGFQVDNETKYYDTAGRNVQLMFVKYLRRKFNDDLDAMNREFGLDYWSNRVNAWEDMPDVRGTINGSLSAEFDKFRRTLVDEFLSWQAGIVSEYKRADQFITHNFDYEWRGYSFGVQPMVNHYHAAKCLTVSGVDIYHPSQDKLTGTEIAFGGDIARSVKRSSYLVLETEAQGFPCWTPYEGQLRLQAYSHLASGANGVMYWHWHSLHNAYETYWKGILSHDLQENETYREASRIGGELQRIGSHLVNLKKHNKAAILVSNESLSAIDKFGIDAVSGDNGQVRYNDVFRWVYDTLYRMNVEIDVLFSDSDNLEDYSLIVIPAMYSAPESLLERLKQYVRDGGNILATFKTAFTNENVKVYHDTQPHILHEALGVMYQQFAFPGESMKLKGEAVHDDEHAELFAELLIPKGCEVLAAYDHPSWGKYAAITRHSFGKGTGYYVGCRTSERVLRIIIEDAMKSAGITRRAAEFPVIVREGTNSCGKRIVYFLNYSPDEQSVRWDGGDAESLLDGRKINAGDTINLSAWDLAVVEE